MTKNNSNNKYLLVVSFLEGRNFPFRSNTKIIIEARFDNEHLSTDPVDHIESCQINQELAWELDKKSLHSHRLQRSAIKTNFFSLNTETGSKENIGYIVLDIRSASEGVGKPKWFPLLQSKYPKSKPNVQINIYVESEQQQQEEDDVNLSVHSAPPLSQHNSLLNLSRNSVDVKLNKNEGYFQIGPSTSSSFILTITIAFARNLLRLLTSSHPATASGRSFYFVYNFLENEVKTKPFEDIVSCQINGEKSSIRLNGSLESIKEFFKEQNQLEFKFCCDEATLGHCFLNWETFLHKLNADSTVNDEYILKLDRITNSNVRSRSASPFNGLASQETPSICIRVGFTAENNKTISSQESATTSKQIPTYERPQNQPLKQSQSQNILTTTTTAETREVYKKETFIDEETQLRAAYELQIWKENREKEFEENLKKLEAKKFQALAEAFKQHDIEREMIIQKKIKDYNELELVLKKSLCEVEKREKQLATNEAVVARLKADLHHAYEQKLLEMREASKRVQENADHQCRLTRSKYDSLEEDCLKYKRQIFEWEKKYGEKEAEFAKYKERDNIRPEIKLQSEMNLLNMEKIELERKCEALTKARNHYKDQWTNAVKEINAFKKREEANAKSLLKKQQMELEHLRLRYLAAEENQLIKSEENQIQNLKNELEK
jgi:hypothetical protein